MDFVTLGSLIEFEFNAVALAIPEIYFGAFTFAPYSARVRPGLRSHGTERNGRQKRNPQTRASCDIQG